MEEPLNAEMLGIKVAAQGLPLHAVLGLKVS